MKKAPLGAHLLTCIAQVLRKLFPVTSERRFCFLQALRGLLLSGFRCLFERVFLRFPVRGFVDPPSTRVGVVSLHLDVRPVRLGS